MTTKSKKLVSIKDSEKTKKFKVKQILRINNALDLALADHIDDSDANYALARNIKKCKDIVEDHSEEELIIYKTYSVKDKIGTPARNGKGGIIINPSKLNEVEEKINKLLNKEVEVDFHLIERSEETDRINAKALADLLDVIIIEK